MRRLLAILALAAIPFAAQAQSPTDLWKIDKFSVELNVRQDGVTEVTETIDANFLQPRHGIYRYVPETLKRADGATQNLGLSLDRVTMDGGYVRVDESRSNGNVVWKIGDPNVTTTGAHEYVIRYFAKYAIGYYADHDEIYWNISGNGWDVPIPNVTAKVFAPATAPPDRIQASCYTGPYGSTETDCSVISAGTITGFVTKFVGEPMTVAVGWPKGLVAAPTVADRVRDFIITNAVFALPAAVFIAMFLWWRRRGKDKSLGPVVAQYEPPDGLRPAETISLLKQNASSTFIAATIIDLATRGYLSIVETTGIFGLGKDYILKMEKDGRQDFTTLKTYEHTIFDYLFGTAGEVKISALRSTTSRNYMGQFTTRLMDGLVSNGYFQESPDKLRGKFYIAAFLMVFVGSIVLTGIFGTQGLISVALTGLIIVIVGNYMPRWSDKGLIAAAHARGFKEFIRGVEKYRTPWMEQQNVFEKVLPYAMVFGLGKKWARAFEGLSIPPPTWYHGTVGTTWSPTAFATTMSGFSSGFNSSSGASSGGGSSGGGGGGGGGGSW